MPSLRDLIIQRLKDAGVRALFGVPGGGGNLDLIDAAGRAGLPFVLTATETAGALAAMGQAEVTGRPGACLTTLGPGAASVANGVACAFLDRAPLFVFTDSHASAANGRYEHQQFDHQAFFRPITKWSGRLLPGCASTTIDRAFAVMHEPPPGPVHIDCPEDFESSADDSAIAITPARVEAERDRAAFDSLLSKARRPIAIVGLAARRREDAAAIRRLLERRSMPALVTYKAKGVVPDAHPCFAGVFTNALIERPIVAQSDLIVGIGLDPVELLPRPWPYTQPVLSIAPWRFDTRHVPFAAQRVSDVKVALEEAEALVTASEWDLDAVRSEVEQQRRNIDMTVPQGLSAQRVVRIAADRLPSSRVTVDAGAHMVPATMLWPVDEPNGLLISNGLSTMAFALPAAIGAALANRDRRVVALTGDGGLLMCIAELMTAVREQLRITVIVFNDSSLSLIELKQQRRGYQAAGVGLGVMNWTALAESFGAAGFAASNESELARALEAATRIDGPSLIDARIDRSNYAATIRAVRG